jgi:hypothetical protein
MTRHEPARVACGCGQQKFAVTCPECRLVYCAAPGHAKHECTKLTPTPQGVP